MRVSDAVGNERITGGTGSPINERIEPTIVLNGIELDVIARIERAILPSSDMDVTLLFPSEDLEFRRIDRDGEPARLKGAIGDLMDTGLRNGHPIILLAVVDPFVPETLSLRTLCREKGGQKEENEDVPKVPRHVDQQ